MPYIKVIDKLCVKYHTPHRKLSLQSEVDFLSFDEFMARYQIQDEKDCLRRMVEYLNNVTPQFVDDSHTESNKIRCLRDRVLRKKWATILLKNISAAQYNFDQLVMVLNESIELEREIQNASTSSKTYYGQLQHILRTDGNMILHIGVTQETKESIDRNDTMIPVDVIKAINETANDRLIPSKDINHEARTDSKTTHQSFRPLTVTKSFSLWR